MSGDHYGNPPTGEVRHYGEAGHFCGGDRCAWHLHTHVNGWCVSSVGEYRPKINEGDAWGPLGAGFDDRGGRLYETMVFPIVSMGHPDRWCERRMWPAWSREEADQNHEKAVEFATRADVTAWLNQRMRVREEEALALALAEGSP